MKILVAAIAALSSPALACDTGSPEPFRLAEWAAEPRDTGYGTERTYIYLRYESTLEKPAIAVEGMVFITDPLDRRLINLNLPEIPDPAEHPYMVFEGIYGGADGFDKMAKLPKDAVSFEVCTNRVAYADGTVEQF